jgi:hypothetical protein
MTRLRELSECNRLFRPLAVDGREILRRTLYYPAECVIQNDLFESVVAYTYVGVSQTWLCRQFSDLPEEWAAMVLIHEALHRAGLGERPRNPEGLHSSDIDVMVSQACGF